MHDYTAKLIHDQKMRQFMLEAERARLIREFRENRPDSGGQFLGRAGQWLRETLAFKSGRLRQA